MEMTAGEQAPPAVRPDMTANRNSAREGIKGSSTGAAGSFNGDPGQSTIPLEAIETGDIDARLTGAIGVYDVTVQLTEHELAALLDIHEDAYQPDMHTFVRYAIREWYACSNREELALISNSDMEQKLGWMRD